jgi:decaprenylphospho-beta-D-ribofuranose 2-oxidase
LRRGAARVLRGWGGTSVPAVEHRSENLVALTERAVLSRGLGRSYGDSSLPPPSHPEAANTTLADRILSFDVRSGVLRAEAGLSAFALNRLFRHRGFFLPVSPGTQFVTLGGMVAADVHGASHHVDGCFGAHVTGVRMRVADGRILDCGPEQERELFWATVGGMGLTGHILEVEFRMKAIPSPWLLVETERMADIDAFMAGLKAAARTWPQTKGWIDCLQQGRHLGRGVLMRGRWATPAEAPKAPPPHRPRPAVPFDLPFSLVTPLSVRAFNSFYYHLPRRARGIEHPDSFFYPLDVVENWNRLYGRRGFTQYQCVLPEAAGPGAARRFLELLTRRGGASMLCVIKDCGPEGQGLLSFPKTGISIALDIPITDGTQALIDALNEAVIAEGGRVYLAKDAFTRGEHFRAMEPRLAAFSAVRRKWDPEGRIRSAQSVRILGDAP